MSSSCERVLRRRTKSYSARVVQLLINGISKIKRQTVNNSIQIDNNRPPQTQETSLDTEDQSPVIIKNEDLYPSVDVVQDSGNEGHVFHLQSQNPHLTPGQKRSASPDLVALEDDDCKQKLYRPSIEVQKTQLTNWSLLYRTHVPTTEDDSEFLNKVQTQTSMYVNDPNVHEPNETTSSSSAAVACHLLPSEVPSSVTLVFEPSDEEEEDLSQSRHPMPQTTTPVPHRSEVDFFDLQLHNKDITTGPVIDIKKETNYDTKLTSGSHLTLETIAVPAQTSSMVSTENYESISLHSEFFLPVEKEEIKMDEDTSPPGPVQSTSIFNKLNIKVLPAFIEGPQDTMFLEEVSMTVRQFNELLENIFIFQCFQAPGRDGRLRLEAVLKFLVRGESIANLAQEYKIAKNTFTHYLPDVLNAIYQMLGLRRVKSGEDQQWSQIQKRFEERLGLPNCCGVLNAKTIITWRPSSPARLPVLTLTDADYGFLNLDMEANIEDSGIEFKFTKMYQSIHNKASKTMSLPKNGFVTGDKHLRTTMYVSPKYSTVSENLPIPYLYNSRVDKALRISENAYGILSTKFKIYDKIMTLTPNVAKVVVKATCALHNWLKQTSPGYLTPGLVDVETKGDVTLGSWRFAPRQIFQPIPFFHSRNPRRMKYDNKRDSYVLNLYNLEQNKNSQDAI